MLSAIPTIQIAHMLNEPNPRELGSCPLQHATRYIVFGFQMAKVRHYGVAPLQLEEYTRSRVLMIAVARKEHLD
jgi:hypothetical protein